MPRRTDARRRVAAALAAAVLAVALAPCGELLYFEAGTVWTGSGEPFAPGAVLVKDGRILHLGSPLKVADSTRKHIMPQAAIVPPFVDAHTYLGLKATGERNETLRAIYPEFRVADALNGSVIQGAAILEEGVLRAYVSPGPRAVVGGLGATIDLARRRVDPGLLTLSVSSEALSEDQEPLSLAGLGLLLREKVPAAIAGHETLRIFAREPADAERAIAFARERALKLVLVGVERPELLVGLELPAGLVVIPSRSIDPEKLRRIAQASAKGIQFAFASWAPDAWHVNLRLLASVASAYGMSREAALRSVTVNAARACGLAGDGVLAAGASADFAVFGGDPLELSAPLVYLVAGGEIRYAADEKEMLAGEGEKRAGEAAKRTGEGEKQ